MATIVPPPARQQSGDILNFLLQMSSAEDRKRYYADVEKRTGIAERQLGIAEAGWEAGKPLRKEAALISKGRRKTIEGLMLTEKQLAIARRTLATSIAYGDKDTADASRFMVNKLDKIKKASPIALETILFADELYKDSRAQNDLQRQQIFSLDQAFKTFQLQAGFEKQYRGSMYDAIMKNLTASNIDAGTAAMGALRDGNMEMYGKMVSSMKATAAKVKMEPEARKFRASEMFSNVIEQFGPGTWQQMLSAEVAKLPYPEVRPVSTDVKWPLGNIQNIMTREEAKSAGAEPQWLESKPIDLEKVQERTQPKPTKGKTVKELAGERARKTKPAGTKKGAAAKSPYPQYPDAFLEEGVWKVIVDGVKYRIEE